MVNVEGELVLGPAQPGDPTLMDDIAAMRAQMFADDMKALRRCPAATMLTAAAGLVSGKRDREHGDKVINHANIAALWQGYVDSRLHEYERAKETGPLIRPIDVALMMALLKIARTQAGAPNPDDYIDGAGYLACAFEISGLDLPE